MNGIILFVTPAVAALGALATLRLFVQARNAAKKSGPRAGSGSPPALALTRPRRRRGGAPQARSLAARRLSRAQAKRGTRDGGRRNTIG